MVGKVLIKHGNPSNLLIRGVRRGDMRKCPEDVGFTVSAEKITSEKLERENLAFLSDYPMFISFQSFQSLYGNKNSMVNWKERTLFCYLSVLFLLVFNPSRVCMETRIVWLTRTLKYFHSILNSCLENFG